MELFDFINIVFTNPQKYSEITPGEKRKHYFMCNRRFAINHPLQANALQRNGINQSAVIDFWQKYLRSSYKYLPKWIYTKGVKKTQEVKEKKLDVSNDLIKEYCRKHQIEIKSVKEALEFFPEQMIKELKDFEVSIKQK